MIPFADLKAQYASIHEEIDRAVAEVLRSAQFILGPAVAAFERAFAAYTGVAEAAGVNSGTSALHLALLAAGVGAGDEVITVPFTFIATVAAILYTGAKPVYVDIDPVTYTMAPEALDAAITPRTKAILPVHLYGHPADMDPIIEVARRHGIPVIEDAAQAHGAEYRGRRAGSLADLACFSFYPGKNLGAYGEGGMVVTNNPEYARTVRMLRDWGQAGRYRYLVPGYNYRMEGLQGAILGVKLRYLDRWNDARRAHARQYTQLLEGAGFTLPAEREYARHIYHVFAVRTPERERTIAQLIAAGVETKVHYPLPAHLEPAYRDGRYREGDFPVSETLARETLSLPIYPEMTQAQVETVCSAMRASVLPAGAPR